MSPLLAAQVVDSTAAADESVLSLSIVKLLIVFGVAVTLWALRRLVRWLLPAMPLSRAQRERLSQLGPLAELATWLLISVWAFVWLLEGAHTVLIVVLTIFGVTFTTAAWFALRDYLAGVIIRVERAARVGDQVRVGELVGRITHLGLRTVQLQTPDGDTLVVPFSKLSREALTRGPRGARAAIHTFVLEAPPEASLAEVAATAREAALLSHWAAPRHEPVTRPVGPHSLEITVRPLVAQRATDLEAAIREAATPSDKASAVPANTGGSARPGSRPR